MKLYFEMNESTVDWIPKFCYLKLIEDKGKFYSPKGDEISDLEGTIPRLHGDSDFGYLGFSVDINGDVLVEVSSDLLLDYCSRVKDEVFLEKEEYLKELNLILEKFKN